MVRIEYLKRQIARAERLAKAILDRQTADRLQAFAAECRTELAELTLKTPYEASWRSMRHTSFSGASVTTLRSMLPINAARRASAALIASSVCRSVETFEPSETIPPSTSAIDPRAAV